MAKYYCCEVGFQCMNPGDYYCAKCGYVFCSRHIGHSHQCSWNGCKLAGGKDGRCPYHGNRRMFPGQWLLRNFFDNFTNIYYKSGRKK